MRATPITSWTVYLNLYTGNANYTGVGEAAYEAGIIYGFSQNAAITFKIRQEQVAGVQQILLYRAQIDYSF